MVVKAVAVRLRNPLPSSRSLSATTGQPMARWAMHSTRSAVHDPRVRWIAGPRAGRPAVPRNRGVLASRGDWLAFLDSDDEWLPGKTAVQLDTMRRLGCSAVCSNAARVLPDGQEVGTVLDWSAPRLTLADLMLLNQVVCSSSIVRRALVIEAGGFPEEPQFKAIEDYALWLRIALRTDFAYCPEPLLRYRDDPGSSVRADQGLPPHRQTQTFAGRSQGTATVAPWRCPGAQETAPPDLPQAVGSIHEERGRTTMI